MRKRIGPGNRGLRCFRRDPGGQIEQRLARLFRKVICQSQKRVFIGQSANIPEPFRGYAEAEQLLVG